MRVSDQRMFDLSRARLQASREAFVAAQERATSGLRVQEPSDDPLASARASTLDADVARADGHLRAATSAADDLQGAESALSGAGELMMRLKEIALEQANGTVAPEQRAAAAAEVRSLREAMLGFANTSVGGRYVFGGYADDSPPFDAAGAYSGDVAARSLEVAPSVRVPVGISGDRAFGASGGTDVFAVMSQLETALSSNDVPTIQASLGGLDAAASQLVNARAQVGSALETVDIATATSQRLRDRATSEKTDLVGADQATSYLEFMRAQSTMQEAIALASHLPPDATTLLR